VEVCPLSRGVMLPVWEAQPLSAPLQSGLRFLHLPLPAALSASLTVRLPVGRATGLPRSARVPAWGRSLLYTGGAPSATDDASPPVPGPSPFGPGVSALWAVWHLPPVLYGRSAERPYDAYRGSLPLTIPRHPGRLNRLVLAVTVSAHASAAVLPDVAALSPGLRTPPLPATHAWVGYGWQNNRLHHFFKVQQLHEQPRVAQSAG